MISSRLFITSKRYHKFSVFFCIRLRGYLLRFIYVFLWLKPIHNYINKLLSIITTKIICLSNAIMKYILEHDKIKKNKYVIINTGVDTGSCI